MLYIPSSSDKMLEKSINIEVDTIIYDLEDSVVHEAKSEAREKLAQFLTKVRETGREIAVRVNSVDTLDGILDLQRIIPLQPDTIVLPKADERLIIVADTIISALENLLGFERESIGMIALLESCQAILNAQAAAQVSTRINGLHLGGEDLAKDLGVSRTVGGKELEFARSMIVYAAKQKGLDAIDCPFTDFQNSAALEFDCKTAKALGMTAKVCIHPSQIKMINNLFSPSQEEINLALRVIEAYGQSLKDGSGACKLDGKMIDLPIVHKAQNTVNKARLFGLI